jgi:RNA recognition motif-containing protein
VHRSNVFFGNLVWECQNEDLSSLLEGYNATEINVMFGRNGRSRGYALVTFANEEAANNAIVSFNEVDFQGRKLEVRTDRGPTTKTQAPREPDANFTGTSVFVANLSWATTSEELKTEFAAYNPVEIGGRNVETRIDRKA